MVEVRTGITDGRYTQIVSGEIKAGDKVIVGLATAKAAATGASPMGAPAGGGRRGF
jgi:HlyD family secretion protein